MQEKTCVRYLLDGSKADILDIIIDAEIRENQLTDEEIRLRRGDISVSNRAPVLLMCESELEPHAMYWGFPGNERKKKRRQLRPIHPNASIETAKHNSLWQLSLEKRRCIIPTSGFYLWEEGKTAQSKKLFKMPDSPITYIAGIYTKGLDRLPYYAMVTTASNTCAKPVRERMPLVLRKAEIYDWLIGDYDSLQCRDGMSLLIE